MADLLVRGVDDDLVQALKKRAGAHGRSQGAELRATLAAALITVCRTSGQLQPEATPRCFWLRSQSVNCGVGWS